MRVLVSKVKLHGRRSRREEAVEGLAMAGAKAGWCVEGVPPNRCRHLSKLTIKMLQVFLNFDYVRCPLLKTCGAL